LDNILADWKYEQKLITEFDNTELPEEQQKTILMTIMPKENVEHMRDHYFEEKFKDNYHAFEQELFNRIEQRKLDEEVNKKTANAVTTEGSARKDDEYEMTEVWSEDWQCWICGLAPKRGRDGEDEPATKRQRAEDDGDGDAGMEDGDKKKPKGKGKRGPRAGGPCWSCGGPHFQRECPNTGQGKGLPHPSAWSAWRPGSFPGPSPQQWRQWMPKTWKGKGKGKGKSKGQTGKGGKGQMDTGKGMGELSWGPTLGQVQQQQWQQPYGYDQWGGDLCTVTQDVEWTEVGKGRKTQNVKEAQCHKETESANRYDALRSDDEDEDDESEVEKCENWPEVKIENAQRGKTKMPRMPKKTKKLTIVGDLCPMFSDVNGLNFQEQAVMIREKCKAERMEAKTSRPAGNVVLCQDKPINAMPQGQSAQNGEWQKLELAVDSGAAETVIPHDLVIDHEIKDTQMSIAGVCYASATGQPIPNLGEQRLPLMTNEGTMRGMKFQAAPVARPLGSVKRMCEAGHQVIFDADGSYVRNKRTSEINWMREENGNYIMDLWVMPATYMQEAASNGWGFRRQS